MTNIETIIKNHNKKIINNKKINKDEPCNCRKKKTCSLEGEECRPENVIWQATIKTDNSSKIYIGLRANQLKKYSNTQYHKLDDKNYLLYKQATELSKLTYKLKNENKNYKSTWKILKREKNLNQEQ